MILEVGTCDIVVRSMHVEVVNVGPDFDARVAIVGAGWAGIDLAFRLKKIGFTNVTILEKSNR